MMYLEAFRVLGFGGPGTRFQLAWDRLVQLSRVLQEASLSVTLREALSGLGLIALGASMSST